MAVTKRLRYEILRRDDHTCRYCGLRAGETVLTVDHVVPQALGGTDLPDNLVACCRDCNAGKSASSPDAPLVLDVARDALRWSRAMQHLAREDARVQLDDMRFVGAVESAWSSWTLRNGQEIPRPHDWQLSVIQFTQQGLAEHDLLAAIASAMSKPFLPAEGFWRYFCGVCWGVLRERQERARDMLNADPRAFTG